MYKKNFIFWNSLHFVFFKYSQIKHKRMEIVSTFFMVFHPNGSGAEL